jgi:SAM-dependent methyltransferase
MPVTASDLPGLRYGDAFGEMLLAVMASGEKPGEVTEVLEMDNGSIATMDAMHYFRDPATWSPPVRWAVSEARGRVLDVGLGAGQHALAAQAAGCQVTGLDISPGALAVARHRGVRNLVEGSAGDLPTLFGPGCFDTIFLLGQNLGMFGSPERVGEFFRALHHVTAPGAIIVGDSRDPGCAPDTSRALFDFNLSRGRWPGQLTLRWRYRDLATSWLDYLYCSAEQLAGLAAPYGWHLAETRSRKATYAAVFARS